MSAPNTNRDSIRHITFAQAINEALAEEMRRDPHVFIIGEDVAEAGTPFKVLSGLVEAFGPDRVLDAPISEPGFAGIGVGAAMTGMRPVVDIMFGDFLTLAMDQIVNQATVHYMSGGKLKVPIVFRPNLGATRRSAAQHSQSFQAWVSHIPGLKVALPHTAYEAKGLLKTAIRDDNPVVFIEDKLSFQLKGPVPEAPYLLPFGVADIKRPGSDITLVATSSMVDVALEAAEWLAANDTISAEVIDPRTTSPLDKETIITSVKKTGRAIVIDEGYEQDGVTAEIASVITDQAFYYLDAPVKRMGAMNVPVPFSPVLEDLTVPTPEAVAKMAQTLCRDPLEDSPTTMSQEA
jgi:pyruvate dehydrogenase E1 component beta subunit